VRYLYTRCLTYNPPLVDNKYEFVRYFNAQERQPILAYIECSGPTQLSELSMSRPRSVRL
jgi:hypothetical protein